MTGLEKFWMWYNETQSGSVKSDILEKLQELHDEEQSENPREDCVQAGISEVTCHTPTSYDGAVCICDRRYADGSCHVICSECNPDKLPCPVKVAEQEPLELLAKRKGKKCGEIKRVITENKVPGIFDSESEARKYLNGLPDKPLKGGN